MSVVDVDGTKPWTKETGFAILSIVGLGEDELRKILPPDEYSDYAEWERKTLEKTINLNTNET